MPDHSAAYLGASGRIGGYLRAAERQLPEDAQRFLWQYRVLEKCDEGAFLWPDFRDATPLRAAQIHHGFDHILIFSGANGAKDDPDAMQAHVTSVDHAITAALRAGIRRLLVASSSAVYGAGRGEPFCEDVSPAPINAYGRAKAAMEDLCSRRAATEGIEICALRIGNVAGADMLLGNAMRRSSGPLTLDIFPDGRGPERSYIGPLTLLSVLRSLIATEARLPPVLNLAGGKPVQMSDLLDAAGVPWTAQPRSDTAHQRITLDVTRLARLCPEIDLDGTAQEIVAEWAAVRAAA
ncbi:NAD-dependent epimerase/dehydratase family protein [Celeribacter sp. SCSIO 80788]|uniref:NAD-dependent epimerase/dehydratase family protein n=1 Tax=Celeribacter sp. SCSIO 80788 TaxID=3117013 RepID=UPI003DA6A372